MKKENGKMVELDYKARMFYIQMVCSNLYWYALVALWFVSLFLEGFIADTKYRPIEGFILYHSIGSLAYDTIIKIYEGINRPMAYIHHTIAFACLYSALCGEYGVCYSVMTLILCEFTNYWWVKKVNWDAINYPKNSPEYKHNLLTFFVLYTTLRGIGVTWCAYQMCIFTKIPLYVIAFCVPLLSFNGFMIINFLKLIKRKYVSGKRISSESKLEITQKAASTDSSSTCDSDSSTDWSPRNVKKESRKAKSSKLAEIGYYLGIFAVFSGSKLFLAAYSRF